MLEAVVARWHEFLDYIYLTPEQQAVMVMRILLAGVMLYLGYDGMTAEGYASAFSSTFAHWVEGLPFGVYRDVLSQGFVPFSDLLSYICALGMLVFGVSLMSGFGARLSNIVLLTIFGQLAYITFYSDPVWFALCGASSVVALVLLWSDAGRFWGSDLDYASHLSRLMGRRTGPTSVSRSRKSKKLPKTHGAVHYGKGRSSASGNSDAQTKRKNAKIVLGLSEKASGKTATKTSSHGSSWFDDDDELEYQSSYDDYTEDEEDDAFADWKPKKSAKGSKKRKSVAW